MKNKKIIAIEFVVLGLILISLVSSAGIVSPYWKDHPLIMNYGETKVVNFNLQNMVGNEDVTVEIKITQGGDIATLEKTTYTAKAGTHDTFIPLTIKVPKNYDKALQTIELEANTVAPNQGGMVSLGTGWLLSFNVVLSEKPVTSSNLVGIIVGLILAIIILAVIIFILVRRKRR